MTQFVGVTNMVRWIQREGVGSIIERMVGYIEEDFRKWERFDDRFDLTLCNPPFHQQQVVGDFLAWRMFTQAKAALTKGGELWIVGNRHLGYHLKLKRLFGNAEQVAATPKFVVLRSIKA